MKKVKIAVLLVTVISFMGLFMLGCSSGDSGGEEEKSTPTNADFDIGGGGLNQQAGSVTAVTITAKAGKTEGTISAPEYTGSGYGPSATVPQAVGTYTVTFEVGAAGNWNAATLSFILTVTAGPGPQTPVATDFTVSGNGNQNYDGNPKVVTVTALNGKTTGEVTVYYTSPTYPKSTTPPSDAGTYNITFDVAADPPNWLVATGLTKPDLLINTGGGPFTPAVGDYDFDLTLLVQTEGEVTKINVTPKSGKSPGAVKVWYQGIVGTIYAKSEFVPLTRGTYSVSFEVEAAPPNWLAAPDLFIGNMIISEPSVAQDKFVFTMVNDGSGVKITPESATLSNTANGLEITLTAPEGYTVVEWSVSGGLQGSQTSGDTYKFSVPANVRGKFNVSVVVRKGTVVYDADAVITVN